MNNTLYTHIHTTKHRDKVALVTGGSTGIGLATAKRLAREGATVFITGRRQAELDAAVVDIGHGARAIRGDITSAADLATTSPPSRPRTASSISCSPTRAAAPSPRSATSARRNATNISASTSQGR